MAEQTLSPELLAFLEDRKRKYDAEKQREAQEKAAELTKELRRIYGPLNR